MKLLIIRFSSLGDIAQCLVVPTLLQKKQPQMEVHWLTKTAFLPLIEHHPHIHKAIGFDTNTNWKHHWHLIQHLRKEQYTHIYDAHSTLRSHLLVPFLTLSLVQQTTIISPHKATPSPLAFVQVALESFPPTLYWCSVIFRPATTLFGGGKATTTTSPFFLPDHTGATKMEFT